jgi:heme/copper-type cytochrome/quinol oxidase subunit 4
MGDHSMNQINSVEEVIKYLPFILPILLVQLTLMLTALIHILKHKNYRFGNRAIWVVIVVAIGIIGPVLYFTVGKGEE